MNRYVVALVEWCRRLHEELLFRAAERATTHAYRNEFSISLTFTLRADLDSNCPEISAPGSVESERVTQRSRPF